MFDRDPLLLPSITDADAAAEGRVVLTGSHGGLYAACLASKAGCRAALFSDAGIGLDDAGVAGVLALNAAGMAAAAICHATARIGDAEDMRARGRISIVNDGAKRLGLALGMAAQEALARLADAPLPTGTLPAMEETRRVLPPSAAAPGGPEIVLVDSASLVSSEDTGRLVVTGSHGGLVGGDPARALKAEAALAVFNDAGIGADEAGVTRLPALETRGIPAVAVAHVSARIGDAASAWERGVLSRANPAASALGAETGMPLAAWIRGAFQAN